jgi:negative regulator of flagellin synthesis FlgM
MKITQKGPADADITQLVKKDKVAGPTRGDGDIRTQQSNDSAKVNISPEARKLQRVAELARTGDELRADKVKKIKEEIESGTYHADSMDVSKSIARSEVARLLEKK